MRSPAKRDLRVTYLAESPCLYELTLRRRHRSHQPDSTSVPYPAQKGTSRDGNPLSSPSALTRPGLRSLARPVPARSVSVSSARCGGSVGLGILPIGGGGSGLGRTEDLARGLPEPASGSARKGRRLSGSGPPSVVGPDRRRRRLRIISLVIDGERIDSVTDSSLLCHMLIRNSDSIKLVGVDTTG